MSSSFPFHDHLHADVVLFSLPFSSPLSSDGALGVKMLNGDEEVGMSLSYSLFFVLSLSRCTSQLPLSLIFTLFNLMLHNGSTSLTEMVLFKCTLMCWRMAVCVSHCKTRGLVNVSHFCITEATGSGSDDADDPFGVSTQQNAAYNGSLCNPPFNHFVLLYFSQNVSPLPTEVAAADTDEESEEEEEPSGPPTPLQLRIHCVCMLEYIIYVLSILRIWHQKHSEDLVERATVARSKRDERKNNSREWLKKFYEDRDKKLSAKATLNRFFPPLCSHCFVALSNRLPNIVNKTRL